MQRLCQHEQNANSSVTSVFTNNFSSIYPFSAMPFQDPIESLTLEERKLTYEQLREMLRLVRVTVEDCANLLGITGRTIYKYVNNPRRVVPEDYLEPIIRIMRGIERYKRYFHETKRLQIGEYLCAWQAEEGALITFDEHLVYGLYGVQDRFEALIKSEDPKYNVLRTDGHIQFGFRLLGIELLLVQKKVMLPVPSVSEKPVAESVVEETGSVGDSGER